MITPVLLCGGSGTRLWPLSRKSYPKQFSALMGAQSLFQASALRLEGPEFAAPLVITGEEFASSSPNSSARRAAPAATC